MLCQLCWQKTCSTRDSSWMIKGVNKKEIIRNQYQNLTSCLNTVSYTGELPKTFTCCIIFAWDLRRSFVFFTLNSSHS